MYDWEELRFEGDEQICFRAKDSQEGFEVISAMQDEMGMTASATLTMKLIEHFSPK